ncbi:MAG TPA: ATP-dependent helicase [Acidimicrobiales bacterium]|nr:ATP-dependent helicase [Acidimicrobiales bacterium]
MAADRNSALLRGLTGPQREAVTSEAAPLCVLAGAGSGKTTVLTRRVARRLFDGSAEAGRTLVVTFTRKASRELRGRLWRLDVPGPVWAGTFHAAAYGQLRRHWADSGARPPSVVDDPRRLLRRVISPPEDPAADSVGAVLAEVQWAQARLLGPEDYAPGARAAGRRTPLPVDEIADIYARYVELKRTRGVIDMGDLLTRCADLLESDSAVAAATRWRIRHLFVDEFQDVNPAQWRLLTAWLGDRADLFVVGDPRQAVYGWNGADPTLLDRLPDLVPGTAVIRLDANHRSTPQVIAAARAVLPHGGDGDGVTGARPDGPVPTVIGFDDDADEAAAVARWLRVMHRPGRPWSHLAVLARTNARLGPVAAALQRAGIPFRVGTGPRAGAEMRAVLGALRAMPSGRPLRSALADLSVPDGTVPDGTVPDGPGPDGTGDGGRRGAAGGIPTALARLADEHAVEEPGASVGGFLAWVAATVADGVGTEADPDADSVELSTFHRAKGLEWPAVALIGLEDGLVPISYATSATAQAEERRLLYVAITRAEESLWCSWACQRQAAGRTWTCRPSPLLDAIEAAGRAGQRRPSARSSASRITALRQRLPVAG